MKSSLCTTYVCHCTTSYSELFEGSLSFLCFKMKKCVFNEKSKRTDSVSFSLTRPKSLNACWVVTLVTYYCNFSTVFLWSLRTFPSFPTSRQGFIIALQVQQVLHPVDQFIELNLLTFSRIPLRKPIKETILSRFELMNPHWNKFFFGDVAFSEIFLYHSHFLLYGEYVVRSFLPNGVFLPCDYGLDF